MSCTRQEMQSSRRQPGRTSRGARTKGARFVSSWEKAISLYYASSARLRVVLKRWWPVSMLDPPPPVSCGSALAWGLDFEVFFLYISTGHPTFWTLTNHFSSSSHNIGNMLVMTDSDVR